ncbi:30S ribosomal protein S8 [Candidatus Gottesmanbacteria bacterium]|nr:30S ribosomal protein S8 [Candidatus Gottesmanbacteria bacterium]
MTSDPISDLLATVKNGYMSHRKDVAIPYSQLKEVLAKVLYQNGYLSKVTVSDTGTKKKIIAVLKYEDKKAVLEQIVRVSKPGRRVYVKWNNIPRVLGGLGCIIISSPLGLITGEQAKTKKVGGEIICKIW